MAKLSKTTIEKLKILRQMYIDSGLKDTHFFPDRAPSYDLERINGWITEDDAWVEQVVMEFANMLYKRLKG